MSTSISVNHYMNSTPTKILAGTELGQVVTILADNQVSGAPVVSANNRVIGFVSEQDCLKQLLLGSYHCDQPALIEDVMRTDVASVKSGDSIIDLAELMNDRKPKIYPVLNNGQLAGVVTRRDVLRALEENQQLCAAW